MYRLSAEVLALSLGVSQSECQWDFLHPVGTRSLHGGRGSGLLHHHTPLLVVPQSGQSAGGCGLSHSDSPGQAESQKGRAGLVLIDTHERGTLCNPVSVILHFSLTYISQG